MAEVLSLKNMVTQIAPADAKITLSEAMKVWVSPGVTCMCLLTPSSFEQTKIDNCCFETLTNPSAAGYVMAPGVSATVKVRFQSDIGY